MPSRISITLAAAAALVAAAMASPLVRRQEIVGIGRKPTEVVLSTGGMWADNGNVDINTVGCSDFTNINPGSLSFERYVALPLSVLATDATCGRYITLVVGGGNVIQDVRVIAASASPNQDQMVVSKKVWDMMLDDGQNQAHANNNDIRYVAGWFVELNDSQG